MAARWLKITPEVRRVLTEAASYAGPRVTITEQLGSAGWQKVKAVLEKAGAVYVVGSSAFEFEPDLEAREVVDAVLTAGRVMGVAGSDGYVATPADLAEDLVHRLAEVTHIRGRRLRVLEPSAGTGRFVAAVRAELGPDWCEITAVEPDARRARQIPADAATTVHNCPFEEFAASGPELFDVVVMNPPFSVPDRPAIWAEHLLAAWGLLAPGGRLVAIVPGSVLHAYRGREHEAGALVREHGGHEALERDAFEESGVTISTVAVWLDKPLTDAVVDLPEAQYPYVFRAYRGDEPAVEVRRPYLSRGAASRMPVQLWRDAWRDAVRTLRYRADCAACERPVWGFDDGENDPRGVLGESSAGFSLDPEGFDTTGSSVGVCAVCANERQPYEKALGLARRYWADAAAQAAKPAPVVALERKPSADDVAVVQDELFELSA